MAIWNALLYQPIWNALVWFYNIIPGQDIGLAIIAITILLKIILFPFTLQGLRSQKALQALQPKIEEIKKKYKGQKEVLAKEMMELYKREKVSPLSSCLPLLIQLPILIALYQVLRAGLGEPPVELLYPFVQDPNGINPMFLGFVDLAKVSIPLAVMAGAVQFVQTRMLQVKRPPKEVRGSEGAKDETIMTTMNKQMMYVMPVITVVIGASLPGGVMLYWLVTSLLTVAQQKFFLDKKTKPSPPLMGGAGGG